MVEETPEPGVLGRLSPTRPERVGRPRAERPRKPRPKRRPAAVTAASPTLAGCARPNGPPPKAVDAPKGAELVTTTIRAAGELAQIGFMVGGKVLRRAVGRLPHP